MTSAAGIAVRASGDATEPVVTGLDVAVAQVVAEAHEGTIDSAIAKWAKEGLDRDRLEAILVYCAERRCEGDGATCDGCRRRTEELHLKSLDDYLSRFGQVTLAASAVSLSGRGEKALSAKTLDQLARTWAGEEYWFWARRVIRKLRHGLRRADKTGKPDHREAGGPAIILMEPQLADNIGMVARAMANFGLDGLRLVAPRDGWPNDKARTAASGANYVIDEARGYDTLDAAIGDLTWVAATTARQRDLTKVVMTPEQAVAEMRRRAAAGERCGVLFGRERNGLETSEIANADAIVMIPVNSRFASLNLAQAVLILGYEWAKAGGATTLGRVSTYERPIESGLDLRASPPASKEEVIGFFNHLEAELETQGFFNPPEKRPTLVRNVRSMFTRMGATEQEIRTLRGIVKALAHGRGPRRRSP